MIDGSTWSTDQVAAMKLMDLIEEHAQNVGIMRCSIDSPAIISQFAAIGEEVRVYTGSWMESLFKSFILYQYGHYGYHFHPKFEEKKRNAPKRVVN